MEILNDQKNKLEMDLKHYQEFQNNFTDYNTNISVQEKTELEMQIEKINEMLEETSEKKDLIIKELEDEKVALLGKIDEMSRELRWMKESQAEQERTSSEKSVCKTHYNKITSELEFCKQRLALYKEKQNATQCELKNITKEKEDLVEIVADSQKTIDNYVNIVEFQNIEVENYKAKMDQTMIENTDHMETDLSLYKKIYDDYENVIKKLLETENNYSELKFENDV